MKKVMTLVAVFLLLLMACGPAISEEEAINRSYLLVQKYCHPDSPFGSAPLSDYKVSVTGSSFHAVKIFGVSRWNPDYVVIVPFNKTYDDGSNNPGYGKAKFESMLGYSFSDYRIYCGPRWIEAP